MDVLERLIDAAVAADPDGIRRCLHEDVRLRALLPDGPVERRGAAEATAEIVRWFEGLGARVLQRSVEAVGDRWRVGYRVADTLGDGTPCVCEQQAFVDVADGLVETVDLVCSGDRPLPAAAGTVHRFDAGALGCADGLPQEFRRRVRAIEVGDLLEVVADDPAAKEDLPALAKLMGHPIRTIHELGDGRVVITVERGR